jgi:uncharacterized protein (DUF2384 family)
MTAILDAPIDLTRPAAGAQAIARLNRRLARAPRIPDEVAHGVGEIAAAVARQTAISRWAAVDPYWVLIIHRAVIQAEEAIRHPDEPEARDQLRIALESLRQGFAAIAEGEPVSDERSPKEIVRWLADTAEVPQAQLADLLRVSLRKFQRWSSPRESAQPDGEDARRVRAVARIINQLRFSLTPTGAVEWFSWPRDDLNGRKPIDLLDEPESLPELTMIAGSMRSTYAS